MSNSALCAALFCGLTAPWLLAPAIAQRQATPQSDANYCARLGDLVEHASDDFAKLKGRIVEAGRSTATLALPDQRCFVEHGSKVQRYVCESRPLATGAEALRHRDSEHERAAQCLGRRWDRQMRLAESFVALNDSAAPRAVLFAIEQEFGSQRYLVRTQIYRMGQQPLEPAPKSAVAAEPLGYCPALSKVIVSGRRHFADLIAGQEAHRSGQRVHWRAQIALPGWEDCFVHEEYGKPACRYYSCKVGPVEAEESALTLMQRISADMRACLGDWRIGRSQQAGSPPGLLIVGGTDQDPYIEVRRSKSLYSAAWNVHLNVNLDLESCNPAEPK